MYAAAIVCRASLNIQSDSQNKSGEIKKQARAEYEKSLWDGAARRGHENGCKREWIKCDII